MKTEYKKYSIIMVLCFLVGGFSIILYMTQVYSVFLATENFSAPKADANLTHFNRSLGEERFFSNGPPETRLESPFSIMLLFSGIILLAGGLSLWSLTREKEIGAVKERLTSMLLLPEERTIIGELKKSKGNMTQSQLVRNTGLSKVKTHRIINKLSAKGIVKKYPYGLTNKIVLEKEI